MGAPGFAVPATPALAVTASSEGGSAPTPRDVAGRLWRFLDAEGLSWCVVGANGAEGDGDIDIVVTGLGGAALARVMRRFARANDVELAQILRHEWSAWFFVFAWPGDDGMPRYLHADVCGDYLRAGRPILAADEIVGGRRAGRDADGRPLGYPVPAPPDAFIYYLVKKIAKGALDRRQAGWLGDAWRADPAAARARIARFWSGADAEILVRAAASGDWREVRQALPELARALDSALRRPPGARWREAARRLGRILRPTGLTIAVLGPDGSGKSRLIEALLPALAPAFRRCRRLHLRPRILGGGRGGAPVDDPHGRASRGALASIAKLVFLLVDYWAGWLFRLWPLRVRSTLIVFDRYYHDLLVDPARYRYGAPRVFARLVGELTPKPDLWLVLDAPAEVLQARKREVPAAESGRQRDQYRALAARLPNAVVIDAAQSPEAVAGQAAQAVIDRLSGRLEARLG